MKHNFDIYERIRLFVIPKIGWLVAEYNHRANKHYYVEANIPYSHYACTVFMGEEELEEVLQDMGFSRNPLASLKKRFLAKLGVYEIEEGSWRKNIDDDYQIHVILFDKNPENDSGSEEIDIYAHKEYRWDTHPRKHYWGINLDTSEGKDYMINNFFAKDIDYFVHSEEAL